VSDAAHPLDAPVWQALTTRQATLARGDEKARRIDPDHGLFAAVAAAIHAAGDTPLLSSYADNDGAIALYRRLGFPIRRDLVFSLFERQ
jgi:hypothetical protein